MISERISCCSRIPLPNENFEYYHSNALLQLELKLERCKLHETARHPTKCDVINDILSQMFDVFQSYVALQTHVH